ncbi:fused PTS fructose transporter subunit IIA/HPr protein [Frischella sp. Ac13]|uniref:Fused PTS fructose transporter subunit IIA/HPr protein n=1 Tax=Frischella japonica TaxID=2741544 RepID=A0ABR7QYX0_9GAMM|nr:fused PTS fructose transporter subunit IIA/HPr protein [Frischella japonica]MBC9131163.1 fused PTS fructose transporter subunit IIA/HPr protein [Frischella japonica]
MLQLMQDDIYLNQQADNKQDAIKQIAHALTEKKYVEQGYVDGMLERESQAATFLGSGIAIPHGTTTTRHLVKKTGVQVFCFPQGVVWGDDGEKAYIAIGIAASSDEHLTLLRHLTHVLGDEDVEERIKQIKTKDDAIALLTGQKDKVDLETIIFDDSLLMLDIPADNMATLQALNASRLKHINAVNTDFVINVIDKQPNYLGQGIWLNDSVNGNLKNAIAISRPNTEFSESGQPVKLLLSIASKNDAINSVMNNLAALVFNKQLTILHTADKSQLISILLNESMINSGTTSNITPSVGEASMNNNSVTQDFVVLNSNGLHTRPSSVLVKIVKEFNSKVTVANLDGSGIPVSATSLMKIVALGAKKGSRLQFTATGDDAQEAINAIGKGIAEGLGEGAE